MSLFIETVKSILNPILNNFFKINTNKSFYWNVSCKFQTNFSDKK